MPTLCKRFNMKTALRLFLLITLSAGLASCHSAGPSAQEETAAKVTSLIEASSNDVASQNFDAAMEKALQAQELSAGNPELQVQALSAIVGIDIMASRDDDAWAKALEAETLARAHGLKKELSSILISKAKLCSYAEISPETGRNDEGLQYAIEALTLAQEVDATEQQCEACFVIASLYINKNRWSNPIDQDIYNTAGEWLDKGQALADIYDLPRLRRNGILFRSRWFQQGDRNEEAIEYFEQALSALPEDDYLTASSLDDRLVRLYTRMGRYQDALDIHDDYVFRMQKYIQQKQDETLQEMETCFEVQEKERALERSRYRTALLVLALLLAASGIFILLSHLRKMRRRNAELQKINDTKEQIIEVISRDLKSPVDGYASKLDELVENPSLMNEKVAAYVEDALMIRARRIADLGLSPREIQIIRLSAEGLKASEIAGRLYLSVNTVNTHRQRIYAKMDVKNVSDMLRKANELGII